MKLWFSLINADMKIFSLKTFVLGFSFVTSLPALASSFEKKERHEVMSDKTYLNLANILETASKSKVIDMATRYRYDPDFCLFMNCRGSDRLDELMLEAVEKGDLKLARAFLEASFPPDVVDPLFERPLLWHAVHKKDLAMVSLLLEFGANPSLDITGHPPLAEAIERKQTAIALELLAYGADPAACNFQRWSMLQLAVNAGDADLVKALLTYVYADERCLEYAVVQGRADLAQLLLEDGVSPDSLTGFGRPVLSLAVRKIDSEMVELLLKFGANPEKMDDYSSSFLAFSRRTRKRLTPIQVAERMLSHFYGVDETWTNWITLDEKLIDAEDLQGNREDIKQLRKIYKILLKHRYKSNG